MKKSDKIRYCIGILFVLTGISGIFSGNILFGLLITIFGISLLPIIYRIFHYSNNKLVQIIVPIFIFFIMFCIPDAETEITNANNINENNIILNNTVYVNNIAQENKIDNLVDTYNIVNIAEDSENNLNTIDTESVSVNTTNETTSRNNSEETKASQAASNAVSIPEPTTDSNLVWIPQNGKKYHSNSGCSNMKNPSQVTQSTAEAQGYTPCKKCY